MEDSLRLKPDDWQSALADTDSRQLVVAGPGTGKTEFLVRRVSHLIESGAAQPQEIVLLSFSRRATSRLRDRIEASLGSSSVPVDVTTFHSLALRLIEASTVESRPVPLTTPEQVSVVRNLLRTEEPADWPLLYRGILDTQPFATEVADFLLRCSERLLSPEDLAGLATGRADWRGLPQLFQRYLDHLHQVERTDYGVLLTEAVKILGSESGKALSDSFRYVVVDEYQDTSPAQAAMAELLASKGNITVAGDPYQSIYSFRGAEVRNIADFGDHPETKRIVLSESFRVPTEIMQPALRIVAGGDLPGSAGPVTPAPHRGATETYVFDQETAEAEWIAREVEQMIRVEGVEPSDIAVVVRSKRQLVPELSRALTRRSIDHDPPDSRLVDHPAVRVVQDAATIAASSPDSIVDGTNADSAMRRLLLGPLFGLSVGRERDIMRLRRSTGAGWSEVLARELPDATGLIGLIEDPSWVLDVGASDGFWELWSRLDEIDEIVDSPDRVEWRRAWTAFGQMLARQTERDPGVSLARFFHMVDEDDFEATPLLSHSPSRAQVTLTTLHQVKGLEFDIVFIANAVEGVFPDLRRSRRMLRPELLSPERTGDVEAQHLFQIQEEMRLAYTAMTRARRRVIWTATDAGVDQGEYRPSRFLIAASNGQIGPPKEVEREPTTVREAEIRLRRQLADPAQSAVDRMSAAVVLGASEHWDASAFAGSPEPGPDKPVLGDKVVLSPSQAEAYATCPRRYVLERKLRLGEPGSVWAHFGELCHDILEKAEDEVIDSGVRHADFDRVREIIDEVWEEDADFGLPDLTVAWKAKAVEMLEKLYDRWPGKGDPIAVEMEVESEIGGVTWVGRVDRVEQTADGVRVVDYKTGTRVPTKDDAAESIQLGFYAGAVSDQVGDVVASEMWFPRADTVSVSTRQFAMFGLTDVHQKMEELTTQILAEDWTPNVGTHCKRCPFIRSCPAWPEGRGAFTA